MPEERTHTVSRREPIVTVVQVDDKKLTFEARPIPRWRARNDFGNEVVKQYIRAMNEWLHAAEADGSVLLEGQAFESVMDYDVLFLRAYGVYDDDYDEHRMPKAPPSELTAAFNRLDFDGMIAVMDAALEVNGLERQGYMLDPRKKEETPEETPAAQS